MNVKQVKEIAMVTFKVMGFVTTAVELFDFGKTMYRKHIQKPIKVSGFGTTAADPEHVTPEVEE